MTKRADVDFFEKKIRHNKKIVQRWHGSSAKLVKLTVSHTSLTIVCWRPGEQGSMVLACLGPRFIHSPISWESSQLELSVVELDSGEIGIRAGDSKAGVEILAEAFEISENCKEWRHLSRRGLSTRNERS